MRALCVDEMRILFTKIIKFQKNFFSVFVKKYIRVFYAFRNLKNKIFLSKIYLAHKSCSFSKKNTVTFGTYIGCFDKNNSIYFFIPALDFLSKCPNFNFTIVNNLGENNIIKGKNIKKKYITKLKKNLNCNDGIIIFEENNYLLGFGEMIKSSLDLSQVFNCQMIIINQSDVGKYIRYNKLK